MHKKRKENYSEKKNDILGILLLAFSVILAAAFILEGDKSYVGTIGFLLSVSLKDSLGYVCYLIPAIFIWWAVTEFINKHFSFKCLRIETM